MAENRPKVLVYRTSGTTGPTDSGFTKGELSIGTDNTNPKIWFKKNNGTLAEFVDKVYVDAGDAKAIQKVNNKAGSAVTINSDDVKIGTNIVYGSGSSAVTIATTSSSVTQAISSVVTEMAKNENVIAGALNDLDERVVEVDGRVSLIENDLENNYFNKTSTNNRIDTKIGEISGSTSGKSTYVTVTVAQNNGKVTGVTVNDTIVSSLGTPITGGSYNSTDKKIYLATKANAKAVGIDATAFIKDGMVSNVVYTSSSHTLTITFNTDAGKSAIDVDLSSLMDVYTGDTKTISVSTGGTISAIMDKADGVASYNKLVTSTTVQSDVIISGETFVTSGSNITQVAQSLSQIIADDEFVTSAALNKLNSEKNEKLESGVNIRTINGRSILGSGDLDINVPTSIEDLEGAEDLVTADKIGDLNDLHTEDKTTVVNAINEVNDRIVIVNEEPASPLMGKIYFITD